MVVPRGGGQRRQKNLTAKQPIYQVRANGREVPQASFVALELPQHLDNVPSDIRATSYLLARLFARVLRVSPLTKSTKGIGMQGMFSSPPSISGS